MPRAAVCEAGSVGCPLIAIDVGDTGGEGDRDNRERSAGSDRRRDDAAVYRDVRHVAADSVHHPAELGGLPGHPRELSIGRVEHAVRDDDEESQERTLRPRQQHAAGHADGRSCQRHHGRIIPTGRKK
jgi:hypothetical protein